MGRHKCAYNCDNSSDEDVKCFKFPLYNPRKLKKWLVNMKWKDWTPSRFSVLCINHFEEQYIDRTGKSIKLNENAVPTIFSCPDDTKTRKAPSKPKGKRDKTQKAKVSETEDPAQSQTNNVQMEESSLTDEEPEGDQEQATSHKWRIIVDERLMKIDSFPHFFHGDYCVPQDIQWAPDLNSSAEKEPENVIEVKEAWQWLGLDVRGPLPKTVNGHKYILSVTDYYSKWVEAVPMPSCLPQHIAQHVVDIIEHFGFPLRILCRLPQDVVHKVNSKLTDQLKTTISLIVHHQQTGTVDLFTQQQIDRMVSDLIKDHSADWDVYLPAQVFSMCFKEHAKTKQRPFSLLCCRGLEPVKTPRELNFGSSNIQGSAFIVR